MMDTVTEKPLPTNKIRIAIRKIFVCATVLSWLLYSTDTLSTSYQGLVRVCQTHSRK